jgi:hypothetical protein
VQRGCVHAVLDRKPVGTWGVFQRRDFPVAPFHEEPPKTESDNPPTDSGPEFCAVYLQEGQPKTFFAALDLILLPRFGSDVARGLSIAFSTDIVIENYRSLVGSFLENVFGPSIYPFITSMYSLAVLIILPILIIGIVFEFSGKKADKRRIRELPQEALAFYYGKEAWTELLRQQERLKDEQAKRLLFEKCRVLGIDLSRPHFLDLYAEMKRLLQDFPTEARDPQT